MPKAKEFTVTITDKPGALGNCLLALAEGGVNILAFQSYVEAGESLARFLAGDISSAKAVLRSLHMIFEETDVAVVRLYRTVRVSWAAQRRGWARSGSTLSTAIADWNRARRSRWWSLGLIS